MVEQSIIKSTLMDFRINIATRLSLLAALLITEKLILEALIDDTHAQNAQGIGAFVRHAQHWGLRFLVTFLAAVFVFAFVEAQQSPKPRDLTERLPNVSVRWILVHALLVAVLGPLSYVLYRGVFTTLGFAAMAGTWIFTSAAAVFAASVGLIPARIWLQQFRSLRGGWIYAAAVALLGTSAWLGSEELWKSTTAITFELVKAILEPFLSNLTADPVNRVIGTTRFAVEITEACSGLEGLGLTLAFSSIWLAYFRREYIFPRALLLIPISLLAIFGLNVLRIATLFLIGNAGYPDVALYGFHSQAGWIAFNAVACTLVYFSRSSRCINRAAIAPPDTASNQNRTAIYLMPLLAILAAGVLSHAMSGKFEVMYPLRFIAGVAVLAFYRQSLYKMDWSFSWRGLTAGLVVFLMWVAGAKVLLPVTTIPDALISLSPFAQAIWISSRLLASILTVPIAEELAYRGYLLRRLGHADFESVPFAAVRWPALTLSSVAFGLGHGALWLPGIVAGGVFGLLVIRSGRLGEALAAHMTTNALLTMFVLNANQWQLW